MGNRKYRTVAAAVLAGAVLFSPLLCGMTRLEGCGLGPSAGVEFVPSGAEILGEFAGSGVVGCLLTHVVLNIDGSDWADVLKVATWVGAGVEAVTLVEAAVRP